MIQRNNMSDFEEIHQNNQKTNALSEAEKYCLEVIREFLSSCGFQLTLSALHTESAQRGMALAVHISQESAANIMDCFRDNHEAKFFQLWSSLVPSSLQQSIEYKKLSFYLHVHFAVLPLRSRLEDNNVFSVKTGEDFYIEIEDGVETFVLLKEDNDTVEETEEESADNAGSEDPELSVVEEERSDAGDSETSMDQDESPLRKKRQAASGSSGMERFRQFLEKRGGELSSEPELLSYFALPLVSNPAAHPSFIQLFKPSWVEQVTQSLHGFLSSHVVTANGNGKSPRMLQLIRSDGRQLNRRFQRLHRDHHHLIGLASELTNALERSVQGHAVDLKVTLDKCARVYPELFAPRSPAKPQTFDLDYRKVKHNLATGSAKARLLLLQALRWRITRSAASDRGLILHNYVRHDMLCLHPSSPDPPSAALLASLLFPSNALTPHPLQQGIARLVNTLASLRAGRDYLAANINILDVLIPCLREDKDIKTDGYTSDMLLAALQKLSLRHKLRLGMIHRGLVEWLVTRLALKTISTYTLEYGCALLMNLCLHDEAKDRCVPLAEQVLKLLARHLGARLPYVNGTLYSLLADRRINAEARRMGLAAVLEYHLKNSDGEMHKQFEYILKLHHTGSTGQSDQHGNDDEGDDTEEMDLLEDELDAADPVPSELNGEELLYQQYRLVFPPQGVVHRAPSEHPLARPTTPRVHSHATQQRHHSTAGPEANTKSPAPVQPEVPAADPHTSQKPSPNPAAATKGDEYTCGFSSRPMIPRTPT